MMTIFLKFVKAKKTTYVYLVEYVPVAKRCEVNYKDRDIIMSLGNLENALIILEIWKRHNVEIPQKIRKELNPGDLKEFVNSVMSQKHVYDFL